MKGSSIACSVMVLAGGLGALTWELLWQHHCALAFGVSAVGTAITLACTMAGMAVGALAMGGLLRRRRVDRPLRLYGLLELAIGLSGRLLVPGFAALERLDTAVFRTSPSLAPLALGLGTAAVLGLPTIAMGATIPVFQLVARAHRTSIARLYAFNTAGAAAGVLLGAFVVLPELGVSLTIDVATCVDLLVAVAAFLRTSPRGDEAVEEAAAPGVEVPPAVARLVAVSTGFATFALEVSWFRSLRAAFQSTSDSFAVTLAAVLIPLAAGGHLAPALARRGRSALGAALAGAAVLVLVATPFVGRADRLLLFEATDYWTLVAGWLAGSLLFVGAPMLLLGTALPLLLAGQKGPAEAGRLYAINTAGAVMGALCAAWVLLPAVGFARTAWFAAAVLGIAALPLLGPRRRPVVAVVFAVALAVAITADSGAGRVRAQSATLVPGHRLLESREGPDATVSVVESPGGRRDLVIDGFIAAGDSRRAHYMAWMGHLPMLLHAAPRRALVICFGTGQTANAVRQEGPQALDLVELSPAVYAMAPFFPANQRVLADPRVDAIVMDGRAYLRRTERRYDVVTLEPLAPYFAGANALYSREFYRLVAARLRPGGVLAQWLPMHILVPADVASVTRTFRDVFPDTLLWVDPVDHMGILLGRRERPTGPPDWPGLGRSAPGRDLTDERIRAAVVLGPEGTRLLGARAPAVTDDDQLLTYGKARRAQFHFGRPSSLRRANMEVVGAVVRQVGYGTRSIGQ